MAAEVGNGQVAIFPTFKGFRRGVVKEIEGAEREGSSRFRRGFAKSSADAGADAGRGFARGFSGSTAGLARSMQADVAKAAQAVSRARLSEQDAAGRVRVAEAQLAEARKRYAADSSQVIRAEERLATTQRALSTAQGTTRAATEQLTAAQSRLASEASRAGGGVRAAFAGIGGVVAQAGSAIASAFSSAMGAVRRVAGDAAQFVGSTFKVVGAAVTATLGAALVGGFSRLSNIETAEARMRGLGLSAEDVASSMDIAKKAAEGTAFSLDEMAGAAASAALAGLRGEGMAKYLEAVKGAATASGRSLSEVAAIFGNVRSNQRAYTDDIKQIAAMQIPIWDKLAEQIGVSGEEVRKMATEGKISAEQFEEAVRGSVGSMATEVGQTTAAAARNARSALSKLGAALQTGFFPAFRVVFDTIRIGLQGITRVVEPLANALGGKLAAAVESLAAKLQAFFQGLQPANLDLSGLAGPFAALLPVIGLVVGVLGSMLSRIPLIGAAFAGLTGPLGLVVGVMASLFAFDPDTLASGIETVLTGLSNAVGTVLPKVLDTVGDLLPKVVARIAENAPILADGFSRALLALVGAVSQIVGPLIAAVVAILPPILTALISMLPTLIQGAVTLFLGLVNGLVLALPQIILTVSNMVPAIVTALVGSIGVLISGAIQLFLALITALVTVIPPLLEAVVKLVPQIIVGLINAIPMLLEGAVQLFLALVNAIPIIVPALLEATIGLIPQIIAALIGMIPQLIQAGVDLFRALVKAVPVIMPQLARALVDMGPSLVQAVWDMIPELVSAGKDLVRGLGDGIASMGKWIMGKIGGVVEGAIGWAKDLLGIHSPSRVFRVIGSQTGEGLALGIQDERNRVQDAVNRFVPDGSALASQLSGFRLAGPVQAVAGAGSSAVGVPVAAGSMTFNSYNTDPRAAAREAFELFRRPSGGLGGGES